MHTSLNKIRSNHPCQDGWKKLLQHLGKTVADDDPLPILTVLDSNGLDDALWCLRAVDGHEKEMRLFAIWCARQVQHLLTDPRSIAALEVAEKFAYGDATQAELDAATAAAWDATRATRATRAARDAARAAARAAAWAVSGAASDAARDAAWAASDAARDAAWAARDAARAVSGAAWVVSASASAAAWAASDAAWDAAWAAAVDAQEEDLRKILSETSTATA